MIHVFQIGKRMLVSSNLLVQAQHHYSNGPPESTGKISPIMLVFQQVYKLNMHPQKSFRDTVTYARVGLTVSV